MENSILKNSERRHSKMIKIFEFLSRREEKLYFEKIGCALSSERSYERNLQKINCNWIK